MSEHEDDQEAIHAEGFTEADVVDDDGDVDEEAVGDVLDAG